MFEPDSVEHFSEGIARLIQLTAYVSNTLTSFNTTEQTRGGIAAYDAGIAEVIDRRKLSIKLLHASFTMKTCMLIFFMLLLDYIDIGTFYGDFSSDILARAKHIAKYIN